MTPPVDWTPPPPRSGLPGQWDRFIGPGATRAENGLIVLGGLGLAAWVLWRARHLGLDWSPLQLAVAALVALDLGGGVIANAAGAAKRWYHRAGQGPRHHLQFVAVHLHPLLIGGLFVGGAAGWRFGAEVYAYLLLAALIIVFTPLGVQRPVALALFGAGLLLAPARWPLIPGLDWFVPILYLKLLVAHLITEAPFSQSANPPISRSPSLPVSQSHGD